MTTAPPFSEPRRVRAPHLLIPPGGPGRHQVQVRQPGWSMTGLATMPGVGGRSGMWHVAMLGRDPRWDQGVKSAAALKSPSM